MRLIAARDLKRFADAFIERFLKGTQVCHYTM